MEEGCLWWIIELLGHWDRCGYKPHLPGRENKNRISAFFEAPVRLETAPTGTGKTGSAVRNRTYRAGGTKTGKKAVTNRIYRDWG